MVVEEEPVIVEEQPIAEPAEQPAREEPISTPEEESGSSAAPVTTVPSYDEYALQSTSQLDATSYQSQLRLYPEYIPGHVETLETDFYAAISSGDQVKAATLLDEYYLTIDVLAEDSGNAAITAAHTERFNEATAAYNEKIQG